MERNEPTRSEDPNSGASSLVTSPPVGDCEGGTKKTERNYYEVFLSFRGKDTRKGFTDYLYTSLVEAGIHVFRDDNELCVGEEIGPELLRSITQSKISIPIISMLFENADAAKSGSLTMSIGYYEVFLNFRGRDTRTGFTDHLYNGLVDAGISVFRDDNELRQGEEIRPDLLTAIRNSKILIPIISVNYGQSRWCLDELVQIMECKKSKMGYTVLPIFYKVPPSHVRSQKGSFGDAFRTHNKYFDSTILEKWKQSLDEVSSLKGHEANG